MFFCGFPDALGISARANHGDRIIDDRRFNGSEGFFYCFFTGTHEADIFFFQHLRKALPIDALLLPAPIPGDHLDGRINAVRGFGKKKVYISEYFCYALFAAARAKRFNCVGIAVCQIFRSRNGEKSAQTRRRAAKAADAFGQIIAHFRAGGTEGTIIFFQIAQKFRVVFKKGSRHTARFIEV